LHPTLQPPPIVPVMVKVGVELKFAVTFAPFTVIAWFGGVQTNPLFSRCNGVRSIDN
jgi:hypothetical protein